MRGIASVSVLRKASTSEEPCAVIPHAGVCGGQSGNWLSYPNGGNAVILAALFSGELYRNHPRIFTNQGNTIMKIKTIFTFTILLFTITTVSWSADKKNFTEADKQDFMKKYFDGEFKKKTSAPESLEEAAYNDAKSKNSVSSYLVYLLKYPEGKYFSKAYELSEIECNKSIKRGLESIFLEEGKVLDTKQIHKNFADKHYDDLSDIRVCIGFIDKRTWFF